MISDEFDGESMRFQGWNGQILMISIQERSDFGRFLGILGNFPEISWNSGKFPGNFLEFWEISGKILEILGNFREISCNSWNAFVMGHPTPESEKYKWSPPSERLSHTFQTPGLVGGVTLTSIRMDWPGPSAIGRSALDFSKRTISPVSSFQRTQTSRGRPRRSR